MNSKYTSTLFLKGNQYFTHALDCSPALDGSDRNSNFPALFLSLTSLLLSSRSIFFFGMNLAETNASSWDSTFSWTTVASTTSKLIPPAVLDLGFASRPSSLERNQEGSLSKHILIATHQNEII